MVNVINRRDPFPFSILLKDIKSITDAISIGYTVGGLTLGFQDASTDNANNVLNAKDDTRTISISAAF